ncbi:Dyp-type peroxidase [Xylariaceae sp. FL0016]|nr:Dyp-type peroxidase [Xylariaceae sp. FL0016]
MSKLSPLDLSHVQADILEGLAKKNQTFFFFRIQHQQSFRQHLDALVPHITSVAEAKDCHTCIADSKTSAKKEGREPPMLEMSGVNIAFSQKGLDFLDISEEIGDDVFKKGMVADAESLGDDLAKWDEEFKEEIHGVILVTANEKTVLGKTFEKILKLFHVGHKNASVVEVARLIGKTRPGKEDGHEHFGFNDGLSQPAVKGVNTLPSETPVAQGVILLGREGDNGVAPAGDTTGPGITRPSWAIDGSFLAFRYLQQLVPEFDAFLEANALDVPKPILPGDPSGAELLGARLVGRWKSGAPIDITPLRDDPSLAHSQDFRFDPNSQVRCPFAAHVRKTNPRADLDGLGGTEVRRILRRGIQFGPEVTDEERRHKKSSTDKRLERGLLFACYQSNLANGFQFIQKSWANTAGFPPGKDKLTPPVATPGIDPIIGVGTPRQMVGTDPDPKLSDQELDFTAEWVVSRGGGYFFSPSIPALKSKFAAGPGEL